MPRPKQTIAHTGNTVTVGSKLPHGLIIEHPQNPGITAEILGLNSTKIIGADVAFTQVDADFYAAWSEANKDFAALQNGAIFAAQTQADAEAQAKDHQEVRTGLEPMQTDGKDPRATGVTTNAEEK